jgi:murein L,D-transpeptidase YcbB/YkuD
VYIGYRTVFVDDEGVVRYRDDVYGRDAKVFRALEAAGVTIPAAQG